MAILKTLLTFLLAGAFVGLATASWLAPKWLEWDNTTRFQSAQTMCDLPQVIRQISSELLSYQLYGTLIGAGVFFILGVFFVVARSKKQKKAQQPPATPSAA